MAIPGSGKKAAATLRALQEGIASGTWPVNSKIPKEAELMVMFGVGKSTVREAVRTLANMGMLEPIKGIGTFVRSRTPTSTVLAQHIAEFPLEELLVYRRALEIEAAQQAALNRSDEQLAELRASLEYDLSGPSDAPRTHERGDTPGPFHHLLFEATGNGLLSSLYAAVMQTIRIAGMRGENLVRSAHDIRHHDHRAILEAIEKQDISLAAHAMALHVDRDLVLEDDGLILPTLRAETIQSAGLVPSKD